MVPLLGLLQLFLGDLLALLHPKILVEFSLVGFLDLDGHFSSFLGFFANWAMA